LEGEKLERELQVKESELELNKEKFNYLKESKKEEMEHKLKIERMVQRSAIIQSLIVNGKSKEEIQSYLDILENI
jgi:hypothetical protein